MSITLTFVVLGCGTNFGGIEVLVFVVPFKTLTLMKSLCEGVWVLDLWGWEDREGIGTDVL